MASIKASRVMRTYAEMLWHYMDKHNLFEDKSKQEKYDRIMRLFEQVAADTLLVEGKISALEYRSDDIDMIVCERFWQ